MREEEATPTWESPFQVKEEQRGQLVRPGGENGVGEESDRDRVKEGVGCRERN